jgi:outer membrane protein assembly factor BamE (lipoprotein component of BamABCDE complex)
MYDIMILRLYVGGLMEEDMFLEEMNSGEKELYEFILKSVDNDTIVIPNLMIEKKDNGTNQIDMIIVNKRGIFVIEYKGMAAKVYGNDFNKKWTTYYDNGDNYKMLNPIKQNENHIKTINWILKMSGLYSPIYNVVVFPDNSDLSKVNTTGIVIKMSNILSTISNYPIIEFDVEKVGFLLKEKNIKNPDERKKHVEYVTSLSDDKSRKIFLSSLSDGKPRMTFLPSGNNLHNKVISYKKKKFNARLVTAIFIFLAFLYYASSDVSSNKGYNSVDNNNNTVGYKRYVVGSPLIFLDSSESDVLTAFKNPDDKNYSGDTWQYNQSLVFFDRNSKKVIGWNDDSSKTLRDGMPKAIIGAKEIKVGSTNEEVIAALGAPQKIGQFSKNTWEYGTAQIYFSSDLTKVVGWVDNSSKTLRKVMPKVIIGAKEIKIGSTNEEVLSALGAPEKIGQFSKDTWEYGTARIYFSPDLTKVVGWIDNSSQTLRQVMPKAVTGAKEIKIGSTSKNVLDSLGAPQKIGQFSKNTWEYENIIIKFDLYDKVQSTTIVNQ